MMISLRVSEIDGVLIKKYAKYHNETVSKMIRRIVFEQIEKDYHALMEEVEVMRLQ